MLRGSDQCRKSADVWAGLIRYRKPSAELSSHRTAGADRAGADLPQAAAAGNQVPVGRRVARANRQRRAQGEAVLPSAEVAVGWRADGEPLSCGPVPDNFIKNGNHTLVADLPAVP